MCQQGNLYDFKKFVIIHYSTLLLLFQNGQNLKKKKVELLLKRLVSTNGYRAFWLNICCLSTIYYLLPFSFSTKMEQ